MIKAIIFDLNGVFVQSTKLSDRFAADFGVSPDKFLPALKEIMAEVRLPGARDCYSYWQPYLQEWGINMNREAFYNYWFSAEKEIPELIEYAQELKRKGMKLLVLSNNFAERTEYYREHFPWLNEIFDGAYFSWETGFVKSEVGAYENILKENDLKGDECLYFDDSEENIELARSLGIEAYLYSGLIEVKRMVGEQVDFSGGKVKAK
ncbi:MAG TPA: HAD family phosphatase [bacterium]|nr:HAD family phosphatase [bacterium]